MKSSEKIKYVGVDDTDIDLFESQYVVPGVQIMAFEGYRDVSFMLCLKFS